MPEGTNEAQAAPGAQGSRVSSNACIGTSPHLHGERFFRIQGVWESAKARMCTFREKSTCATAETASRAGIA